MRRWLLAEVLLLTALAAAGGAALALQAGGWSWSWDGLNHHVYLGLIAEHPRWHLDVLAADSQGYQFPYLYWPIYRIALLQGSGVAVAMAWAAAQAALLLPPVWLLAHRLLHTTAAAPWEPPLSRGVACLLAYLNTVILLGLGMSANDLLAASPLLWAIALYLGDPESRRRLFWCAALFGVSLALKWSNAVMLPLLGLWWLCRVASVSTLFARAWVFAAGALAGFALVYFPWGLQLWRTTGNPFYPFFRTWLGGY